MKQLCAICKEAEHDTICDSCGRVICYGCEGNDYDDAAICTECTMQLRDEEREQRKEKQS